MDTLQRFGSYAADFELTYKDDDWSRLYPHFTEDAVYEVKATAFGCTLTGPKAICAGMKKSLDGFDRRFERRDIAVTSPPSVDGDEMRIGWQVTYTRDGLPPFVLRGTSLLRVRDGRIAYLADSYEPAAEQEFAAWRRQTGFAVDVSYV